MVVSQGAGGGAVRRRGHEAATRGRGWGGGRRAGGGVIEGQRRGGVARLEVCLSVEALGLNVAAAARDGGVGLVRGHHEHVGRHRLVVPDLNQVANLHPRGPQWPLSHPRTPRAGCGGTEARGCRRVWTRAERRALTFAHTDSWIASPTLRWAGELLASLSARWRALSCAREHGSAWPRGIGAAEGAAETEEGAPHLDQLERAARAYHDRQDRCEGGDAARVANDRDALQDRHGLFRARAQAG